MEKVNDGGSIDSITQDELDFFLKSKLRMTPEERYQARKGKFAPGMNQAGLIEDWMLRWTRV